MVRTRSPFLCNFGKWASWTHHPKLVPGTNLHFDFEKAHPPPRSLLLRYQPAFWYLKRPTRPSGYYYWNESVSHEIVMVAHPLTKVMKATITLYRKLITIDSMGNCFKNKSLINKICFQPLDTIAWTENTCPLCRRLNGCIYIISLYIYLLLGL